MKCPVKRIFLVAMTVLSVTIESGCASSRALQKNVQTQEIRKSGGNLLKAFVENDAKAFLSQLPEIVSEEFGEGGFKKTRESMIDQLGKPISYEHVFNLEHPKFTVSIWKIRFERKSSDQKKTIHQEALFRVVSAEIDGKEKLLSFNFF